LTKFATIHTKARFNLASFMEEVQAIMGVPEWYIFTDSRHTKQLHAGRCLQIQVNIRVPYSIFVIHSSIKRHLCKINILYENQELLLKGKPHYY
jgi:hypothetical protein